MSSSDHEHPELGAPELHEVGDGVFAYIQPDGSWFINNTGFVVGSSSVISIDSCSTERRTRAFRKQISAITPSAITTLVNTHNHGDHTYGNSLIGAATIVGHEKCRTQIIKNGLPADTGIFEPIEWGDLALAPPTVTFDDRIRLWSDDQPVELSYVGQAAHTTNDILIWLPDQQVLFCGDLLFNGGTPFLLSGSVAGAIDVLTNVLAPIPAKTIIPGHGAPCDRALIATIVDYLQFVLATARSGRDAGLSPLEVARETDLGEYTPWLDSERIVGNLHRAYADLDPASPDVDMATALTDMVTYNGGKPLSCSA
jgi:cyclase